MDEMEKGNEWRGLTDNSNEKRKRKEKEKERKKREEV